ncbi:MAG: RNA pseudouridine synthase [Chlamydiia bacterium]|nr:RNA pseudouridine synthase [Chlamydiia bacterium]
MKLLDSVEILYCDNHVLMAVKPCGLLTQPDASAERSLEELAKAWVKKEYQKPGAVFLHCIHRLDKAVSGLVLFARTSKALTRLNEQSRLQEIQRTYIAEVEGILSKKEGQLDHYLIHGDHRAVVAQEGAEGAKHARLLYRTFKEKEHSTFVEIALETGRYHQIRAQFAAIGHPIWGDLRYGSKQGNGESIHLHGQQIGFKHPVTQEVLSFQSLAPFV